MLDHDLAKVYEVETKQLKQQVKQNLQESTYVSFYSLFLVFVSTPYRMEDLSQSLPCGFLIK